MKGYKASYNQMCMDQRYEVGQTYTLNVKPKCCWRGFHFCQNADDVFAYYPYNDDFVLFEINAIGYIDTFNDKSCTNKIEIVRIIPKEEYIHIFNKERCEFDEKINLIYYKNINGCEYKYDANHKLIWERCIFHDCEIEHEYEYNSEGTLIYYKCSNGTEIKYDNQGFHIWERLENGKEITLTFSDTVV
jgi:hypothetical protein